MDRSIGSGLLEIQPETQVDAHPGCRLVQPEEWFRIQQLLVLTRREAEVLRHLFEGETVASSARRLAIKQRTVRQYLEQIYFKLQVQDRVKLVLVVIECRDQLRGSHRQDAADSRFQ